MPSECHASTMNTIELQVSDAVADISMLQCSDKFLIQFINAHIVADDASHALASSATAKPTFNFEEEVVVIRTGWSPKKKNRILTLFFYVYSTNFRIYIIKFQCFVSMIYSTYIVNICTIYYIYSMYIIK